MSTDLTPQTHAIQLKDKTNDIHIRDSRFVIHESVNSLIYYVNLIAVPLHMILYASGSICCSICEKVAESHVCNWALIADDAHAHRCLNTCKSGTPATSTSRPVACSRLCV